MHAFASRAVRRGFQQSSTLRQVKGCRFLSGDAAVLHRWLTHESAPRELQFVSLEHENGVARVELKREAKLNAISLEMFEELEEVFRRIDGMQEDVRCVLLGAKGASFCAGIDLGALMALQGEVGKIKCPSRMRESLARVIARLQHITGLPDRCHAPVISLSQGKCIGAGVDLITACDLRLCTADASFSVKEVDLGIVADLGTLQRLPGIVGEQRARELSYTGRFIDSEEAVRIGLILEQAGNQEAMEQKGMELATTIASKSSVTVRGVKANLNFSRDHTVQEGLDHVLRWNAAHLLSAELGAAFKGSPKKKE